MLSSNDDFVVYLCPPLCCSIVHGRFVQIMDISDAAERYMADGAPVIVIAGADYGSGSSRDWAAKCVSSSALLHLLVLCVLCYVASLVARC